MIETSAVVAWGLGMRLGPLTRKGHEEFSWDGGDVLYFNFKGIIICQNSLICVLKIFVFYCV